MQSPAASVPFAAAGRRHFTDGSHLFDNERHVNADHLAGLAAECTLKALLVEYLGIGLPQAGPPLLPDGGRLGHLPNLWPQVAAFVDGRAGAELTELLADLNPFEGWRIDDRYSDGGDIDEAASHAHLEAASRVLAIREQAQLNGAMP